MENKNKKIKKTVIITGYTCNNNCRFCINLNKRKLINKSTKQIIEEMVLVRKKGFTYLELIGGEPTIRPDIIDLIKFARQLKFENIMMATNGRLFAYKEFTAKIIQAGLTDLIFSIHGYNAKLHDFLTRSKGSFQQMMQGIKNVKALGLKRLGTNTTIVKQNYRYLKKIGQLILKLGFRNSEFIFVDPTYGAAYDNFFKFVPKISQAAPCIRQCLDLGKDKVSHWTIRYVPLCHFTGYENQISELQESVIFHTQHLAPDYINLDVEKSRQKIARTKTKKCKGCKLFNQCEGIWMDYLKHYGDRELKPIK
jgi:MoaA/NifB/PqqE/SkfB family radical SAM enzyme